MYMYNNMFGIAQLKAFSCAKNPKSYHIIYKAERPLLHERIGNINYTLYMYELKRQECFSQPRNLIQDNDLSQCSLLINKIKEFRHNRTKSRKMTNSIGYPIRLNDKCITTMVLALLADICFLADTFWWTLQ